MTSKLTLVSGSEEFLEELDAALQQAVSFSFCTPAIDSGWGRWPVWKLVHDNLDRLQRAYVALDGMRSEPYALQVLYRSNALRLVPAADGSFRVNLWRIRHRRSIAVFTGAGDLCVPGMVAPVNAIVKWTGFQWTGFREDPFALKVERLIDEIAAISSVPDRSDLSDYVRSCESCSRHWDEIHREGRATCSRTTPFRQSRRSPLSNARVRFKQDRERFARPSPRPAVFCRDGCDSRAETRREMSYGFRPSVYGPPLEPGRTATGTRLAPNVQT